MNATIIIPWRDTGCPHRRNNHQRALQRLGTLGWPIISADDPTLPVFSVAAARNRGAAQADTDIVVMHDADLDVPLDRIKEAVEQAHATGGMVHPYERVNYLDQSGHTWHVADEAPGGCYAIPRQLYQSVGGNNEQFVGWGYEDNEFAWRITQVASRTHMPGAADHLWHPIGDRVNAKKNKALLDELTR